MYDAKKNLESSPVLYYQRDSITYFKSIFLLDSAIVYDSTNSAAYLMKSELLCNFDLYERALLTIRDYNKKNPGNINLQLREALLLEKMGDLESAKAKYRSILQSIDSAIKENNKSISLITYKVLLISLLNDSYLLDEFNSIKKDYASNLEIQDLLESLKETSREEFIHYQISGGKSLDNIIE